MSDIPTLSNPSQSMPDLGAYKAPELIEYGTLKDVTLAVATTSTISDSGTGQMNKTS